MWMISINNNNDQHTSSLFNLRIILGKTSQEWRWNVSKTAVHIGIIVAMYVLNYHIINELTSLYENQSYWRYNLIFHSVMTLITTLRS